jgi:hypothetical protein
VPWSAWSCPSCPPRPERELELKSRVGIAYSNLNPLLSPISAFSQARLA